LPNYFGGLALVIIIKIVIIDNLLITQRSAEAFGTIGAQIAAEHC